jgi:hypothetical protein
MMNEPDNYNLVKNPQHDELANAIPIKQSQLEARAKQYFNEAKPLDGTLAQSYLNKQGIDINQHDNLRYHPAVFSSEKRKTYPALITNITNDKNETKAVEITYLDKASGNIAELKINKRILGSKSGNITSINKGSNTDYSIVAVGVENALTLNRANKSGADIIALNNNNDAKTINTQELRDNVIVVLDINNPQDTQKLASDITNKLELDNKHVIVIEPSNIIEGLNKIETTKQLVEEAVHNITQKDHGVSKLIQNLNNDIALINRPAINNNKHEPIANTHKHDEHYQHLAIDSQRSPSVNKNIELPKFEIGEKTI